MYAPHPDKTAADLSRYVAIGDSITAGYADGALYYEGQQNSYAHILAGQIQQVGGGSFKQPLLPPGSVGVDLFGNSRLTLIPQPGNPEVFVLKRISETGDASALQKNSFTQEGPYANMGVPGAKVITTLFSGFGNPANGPGNFNPFFTRMASEVVTASVLSDALLNHATFFSIFIGNNDALAYALAGCTENVLTPCKGPAGIGFEESLLAIINALAARGARGVIANLPAITDIPYFNAIPYNGLLLNTEKAALLTQKHAPQQYHFYEGENAFIIADPNAPNGHRLADAGELILMDLLLEPGKDDYLKGYQAIPKKYTLTLPEKNQIEKRIEEYNAIIRRAAFEKNLALVDVHHLVKSAKMDRQYNPATFNLDYSRKGVFSLDGLHPNSLGQALLANEFIKAINLVHGTNISGIRSHRYKGITFP